MNKDDIIILIKEYLLNNKEFISDIRKYLKTKIYIHYTNSRKLKIINALFNDSITSQFLIILVLSQLSSDEIKKGFKNFNEEWNQKLDKYLGVF